MSTERTYIAGLTEKDIADIASSTSLPSHEVRGVFDADYLHTLPEAIAALCRKARQEGEESAKAHIRDALGFDDALFNYLSNNNYQTRGD